MAKNNIRLLSKDELNEFINRYSFEITEKYIIVKVNGFNRPTLQHKNEMFSISCKGRYLNITPESIKLWENNFKEYSLIEVQQAINKLYLMYQETVNVKDIKKILNNEV